MKDNAGRTAWRLIPVLALLTADLVPSGKQGSRPALVLRDATVIDATGSPPKADYTVVIVGDRISAMGVVGSVPIPKGPRSWMRRSSS